MPTHHTLPRARTTTPKIAGHPIYATYNPHVRTNNSADIGRRLSFGRLVATALSRYQTVNRTPQGRRPTQADFATAIGIGRTTLGRWIRGDWAQDPEPANVDAFVRVAGLETDEVYTILGWGHAPERPPSPPMRNPRVVDLERLLEDPHVPESYKAYVQTTLDLLLRNSPISD